MTEQRLSVIRPAERDADGNCIDVRCTRYGGDWESGDRGRCVGMHCPHCDTPCSSQGHNCPKAPGRHGLIAVSSDAPELQTQRETTDPEESR